MAPCGSRACTPQAWFATWVTRRSTTGLASASVAALSSPIRGPQPAQHGVERVADRRVQVGAEAEGDPAGRGLRVHRSDRRGGRPGRASTSVVMPHSIAVPATSPSPWAACPSPTLQQRAGHGHRQVERRSGDQFLAVDVAAADGAGRDRRVLAGLVPGHPGDAEERRDPDGVAVVVRRRCPRRRRSPRAARTAAPRAARGAGSAGCPWRPRRSSPSRQAAATTRRTASTSPGVAPRTATGPVRQCPRRSLNIRGRFSPGVRWRSR